MSRKDDIRDLTELGLDPKRLEQHTNEELAMALCAVQESGTQKAIDDAAENMPGIPHEELAVNYAESALGW